MLFQIYLCCRLAAEWGLVCMKVREMIGALQLNKKEKEPNQLYTIWGENLDKKHVLEEYPRPQLVRKNYTILNGEYQYAMTKNGQEPKVYDGTILVPFSPESALSGAERQLKPDEFLWYQRTFYLEKILNGKRLLLHFGACDERCRVYVNGQEIGRHSGGYQAFSFDITQAIQAGDNTLQVRVRDESDTSYHGRGKQKLKNGGMFYTAQSGIWQTVWYEWVPQVYVEKLWIKPLYDENAVSFSFSVQGLESQKKIPCEIQILENDTLVSEGKEMYEGGEICLPVPHKKSWTPASPFLYRVKITFGEDEIESYFGMRMFSVESDKDGIPRLCLNHIPYFQRGVLDQGYWPESLMTPPSDEAMVYDILMAKELGFNMIRKHCKIEPMRWYYHCDRLGMLVWQDMINGGGKYHLLYTSYIPTVFRGLRKAKDSIYSYTSRQDKRGRMEWKKECQETVEQLYNCPCICTWVLFNEGWGQFDAQKNTAMVLKKDDSRWIDAHSGWFDQGAGDMKSEHIYFFDLIVKRDKRPYVISEFGGLTFGISKHSYSDEFFGYENYDNQDDFLQSCNALQSKIKKLKTEGLCACVYTQLTDVEEEANGLLTYDRRVIKIQKNYK